MNGHVDAWVVLAQVSFVLCWRFSKRVSLFAKKTFWARSGVIQNIQVQKMACWSVNFGNKAINTTCFSINSGIMSERQTILNFHYRGIPY